MVPIYRSVPVPQCGDSPLDLHASRTCVFSKITIPPSPTSYPPQEHNARHRRIFHRLRRPVRASVSPDPAHGRGYLLVRKHTRTVQWILLRMHRFRVARMPHCTCHRSRIIAHAIIVKMPAPSLWGREHDICDNVRTRWLDKWHLPLRSEHGGFGVLKAGMP